MAMTFHSDGRIDGFSQSSLPAGSVVQVQSTTSTAGKGQGGVSGPIASGLITTLTPVRASSTFFVMASGMAFHNNAGCLLYTSPSPRDS